MCKKFDTTLMYRKRMESLSRNYLNHKDKNENDRNEKRTEEWIPNNESAKEINLNRDMFQAEEGIIHIPLDSNFTNKTDEFKKIELQNKGQPFRQNWIDNTPWNEKTKQNLPLNECLKVPKNVLANLKNSKKERSAHKYIECEHLNDINENSKINNLDFTLVEMVRLLETIEEEGMNLKN